MRNALRMLLAAASTAALAACAPTVALTPHDGGQPAYAEGGWTRDKVAIRVDGKVYRGVLRTAGPADPRVPVREAGRAETVRAPVAVGRYYGQRGAGGQQVAVLTAEDGARIDCRFTYGQGGGPGSGLCRSYAGRSFSLTLR